MTEKVYFFDMFSDFEPPETLKSLLSQAVIVAADIDAHRRSISVVAESEVYIPKAVWDQAAKEISEVYGLGTLEVNAAFPETQLHHIRPEELRDMFVSRNSMTRGSLAGAQYEWDGSELTVKLVGNGKKELEELVPAVQTQLREMFAAPVTIRIEAGQALEGQALFDAMESMRYSLMEQVPVAAAAKKEEKKPYRPL